jgi:hypothetical protein
MQQARSRMPLVGVLVRRGAAPVLAPRVADRARDATPCAVCMHVRDRRVIGSCHSTRQALVLYHYTPWVDVILLVIIYDSITAHYKVHYGSHTQLVSQKPASAGG